MRHAQRATQPIDRSGPHDPLISNGGHRHAEQLGDHLSKQPIKFLFCSPFTRTVQTAQYISLRLNIPIFLEWGIGEYLNPDWFSSIPVTQPYEVLNSKFDKIDLSYEPIISQPSFPETQICFLERCKQVIRSLISTYDSKICLVTHGSVVVGIGHELSQNKLAYYKADCCSVSHWFMDEDSRKWQQLSNGSLEHLTDPIVDLSSQPKHWFSES